MTYDPNSHKLAKKASALTPFQRFALYFAFGWCAAEAAFVLYALAIR